MSLLLSDEIVQASGLSEYEILKQLYNQHIPEIEPFPGVIALLTSIKSLNGSIGVVTDGYSLRQRNKLKSLNLVDMVDYLVISEEIGSTKPSIENFLAVENKFNAQTYYYIADNFKKDFIAPNNLGWITIGLMDNGLNVHHEHHLYIDDKYLPHQLIWSLDDITISGS